MPWSWWQNSEFEFDQDRVAPPDHDKAVDAKSLYQELDIRGTQDLEPASRRQPNNS